MEEREAFQLLTLASVRDGRPVTQMHAKVWAADLADVAYEDAVNATRDHYRESSKWIMPADVIERVKQSRRKHFAALTMSPEAPDSCPDGAHRWLDDGTCLNCNTKGGRREGDG